MELAASVSGTSERESIDVGGRRQRGSTREELVYRLGGARGARGARVLRGVDPQVSGGIWSGRPPR